MLTIAENAASCGIGSSAEYPVSICGPGPGCGCRIIEMPRVQITPETLDYTITKDNPVQLEVEFTILADCDSGVILTMEDSADCSAPTLFGCSSDPIPRDLEDMDFEAVTFTAESLVSNQLVSEPVAAKSLEGLKTEKLEKPNPVKKDLETKPIKKKEDKNEEK